MSHRLLYLALTAALIGLLLLAYAAEQLEPPQSRIRDVTGDDVGRMVRVRGHAERVHVFRGGSAVIKLSDDGSSIDVYLPYRAASQFNVSSLEGRQLEVTGSIAVYEGRLELKAESLDRIKVIR